jgi:hypothetical protein
MRSIFDRDFKYVRSVDTDLRKTFARIRRQQQSKKQVVNARAVSDVGENILTLGSRKQGA